MGTSQRGGQAGAQYVKAKLNRHGCEVPYSAAELWAVQGGCEVPLCLAAGLERRAERTLDRLDVSAF